MEASNKVLVIAVLVITLGVVALFLQPAVEEQLLPELVAAWVGIEIEGSGVAVVGPVEAPSDVPFTLHGILEGRARDGRRVLYTEAPAVEIDGERVPTDEVRPWERHGIFKVRWATVEGERPYVRLEGRGLDEAVRYSNFLRTEWPQSWSVTGEIAPAFDDHLAAAGNEVLREVSFGTLRYRVQFEFYKTDEDLVPRKRIASWGADELIANLERFPTMVRTPSPALAPATAVFGLPHVDLGASPEPDALPRLAEMTTERLAWNGLTVLSAQVRAAGRRIDDLTWTPVDLPGGARWGETLHPGDLLRVGERAVVAYEAGGEDGILDYDDLCLDFALGASVSRLRDVFSGEGLTIEHASLHPPQENP